MVSGVRAQAPYYYVPQPSKWPLVGSIALVFFGFGLASWFNGARFGPFLFAVFVAILVYMMVGWFTQVARESESGLYSDRVDVSFRWSMAWFIFSEVMFFSAWCAIVRVTPDVSSSSVLIVGIGQGPIVWKGSTTSPGPVFGHTAWKSGQRIIR